jgi:hypothetical protein
MGRASHILTLLSISLALTGIALYAIAASPTSSLPPDGAVNDWAVLANSDKSGEMGSKASYDAYNGAVEALQSQGIRYFAQRTYRRPAGQAGQYHYVTLDVYQLRSVARARKLYENKRAGYKAAKPLVDSKTIRDRAFVATISKFSVGVCQRGIFVCEVSLSQGRGAADRAEAERFLDWVSGKLGS